MKRTDITEIFPEATKEQIDRIMDLSGAEVSKVKKDLTDLQGQFTEAKTRADTADRVSRELQEAKDRAQSLETELNGLKSANKIRDIREAVAKDTGVPANLLTAETEEACKAQAKDILDFAGSGNNYPSVSDGGSVNVSGEGKGLESAWQAFAAQISAN